MVDEVDAQSKWAQVDAQAEVDKLCKRILHRKSSGQQCCRCNGNGTCTRCECSKMGRACSNCTPGKRDRCQNRPDHVRTVGDASRELIIESLCDSIVFTDCTTADNLCDASLSPQCNTHGLSVPSAAKLNSLDDSLGEDTSQQPEQNIPDLPAVQASTA